MSPNILYHHPLSMKSQIVRLAFEEKCVDYTAVTVDTGFVKEIYRPWFVALNESASVPVLVAGDHILAGAKEILAFLDTGDGAEWRAVFERFPSVSLHFGLMPRFCFDAMAWDLERRIKKLTKLAKKFPDLSASYLRKIEELKQQRRHLAIRYNTEDDLRIVDRLIHALEVQLASGKFLNGKDWSVGDAVWAVCLTRLNWMGLEEFLNPARFPRVACYFDEIVARPAFGAAGLCVQKPRFLLFQQIYYSVRAALRGVLNPDQVLPVMPAGNANRRSW